MRQAALLLLAFAAPVSARQEQLTCPPPRQGQVFLSPMGEPFRAPKGQPYPVAAWFAQADADHDGKLTLKEFVADADRFFLTLDHDHNGEIDPQEVEAYENQVAPELAIYADRGRDWDKPSRRAQTKYDGALGAGRFAFLNIPEPVSSADADMNRGISRAEFADAATRRFGLIDKTGQRRLVLADLPKTPSQTAADLPCKPYDAGDGSGSRHHR